MKAEIPAGAFANHVAIALLLTFPKIPYIFHLLEEKLKEAKRQRGKRYSPFSLERTNSKRSWQNSSMGNVYWRNCTNSCPRAMEKSG
jgi:hypothetical protein